MLAVRIRRQIWCEDIHLEEALADEFLQVPSEALTMDNLVLLSVIVAVLFFSSRMRGVALDGSQTPDPGLRLDGVEDIIDGELSEVNCSIGL